MKASTSNNRNWYVLYTRPHHEKKLAARLNSAGYIVFCPFQKVRRKWSDRTKMVVEPLFKGIIFIQIEDCKRNEVLLFPGAVRYLFWQGRPAIVGTEEIATIQKWLGHYENKLMQVCQIKPGSKVRVISGKFINAEGVLVDVSDRKALMRLKELSVFLCLDLSQNEIQALQ
jgi:transcription antitermination factor NusG